MTIPQQTIQSFLTELSSKNPTPGGGVVAGVLSALSSALANMVIAYSTGKASLSEHEQLHNDCAVFLESAATEALVLAEADAVAYQQVNELWKLPEDDELRISKWDETLTAATMIPIKTMELSERVLITLETLVGKTNAMLASDLAIAAICAEAAARAGFYTAQINIKQLNEGDARQDLYARCSGLVTSCKDKAANIEASCGI
ncbi:MAG: cyclodeaminase/cyclohydrolase family protein [Planctomycetota bacterium]|nr:cyclodeaminase/cyclohydrolase family protein [Planctomycetota bacterium]